MRESPPSVFTFSCPSCVMAVGIARYSCTTHMMLCSGPCCCCPVNLIWTPMHTGGGVQVGFQGKLTGTVQGRGSVSRPCDNSYRRHLCRMGLQRQCESHSFRSLQCWNTRRPCGGPRAPGHNGGHDCTGFPDRQLPSALLWGWPQSRVC